MATQGFSQSGASILPSGTYTTDLSKLVREINAVGVAFTGVFGALKAGIGAATAQVESFVAKSNPAEVIKFKLAVDDLYGVIGRMMVPVLNNLTTTFQKLADYLYALSPAAKTMIAGLTAAAVGFVVVTAAVWALNAAFSTLTGGLSAILGALGSMTAGVMFASAGTDELKSTLDALLGPMSEVANAVGEVVTALAAGLAPILTVVAGLFANAMHILAQSIEVAVPLFIRLAAWIKVIAEFIGDVLGFNLKGNGVAPERAPNAVRSAQSGSINDFITRQYVAALQGASVPQKQLDVMKGLAKDVEEIRDIIKKYIGDAKEVRSVTLPLFDIGKAVGNPAGAGIAVARFLAAVTG